MSTVVNLFPAFTDQRRSKIKYNFSDYSYFYNMDNDEFELLSEDTEGDGKIFSLSDDTGHWKPDLNNVGIRRSFEMSNLKSLFGSSGIVCGGAKLGIALMWTSQESRQRGSIDIGSFNISDDYKRFHLEHHFLAGQFRGKVHFETVLYIKEKGLPAIGEEYFANEPGIILGSFGDMITIVFDGNGSLFPIIFDENASAQSPLWDVMCNWNDPATDSFYENVLIRFNVNNKNYKKYLDKDSSYYDPQLFKEILASAVSIIVAKVRENPEDWDAAVNGTELNPGSVSEAVYYFINTLEWNLSSPEVSSLSIRKFFDQRMQI